MTTEVYIARLRSALENRAGETHRCVSAELLNGVAERLEYLVRIERAALPEAARKIAAALPEAKTQWDSGNPKVCNDVFEWCFDLLLALRAEGNASLKAEIDHLKSVISDMESEVRALKIGKGDFRHLIGIVKEIINGNAKAHAALDGTAYSSMLPVRIGERCADALNELKRERGALSDELTRAWDALGNPDDVPLAEAISNRISKLNREIAESRQVRDDFKRAASLGSQPIQGPEALTAEIVRLRALVEEERGQHEKAAADLKSAINRLHRRCQEAEGVAAVKTEKQPGPSMARSMLRWHNGQLQRELAASKERAEAYAVQCGQLQRETERMDRELGEANAENRRLQGQLIAEQRKKEALRDCGAGILATGKEPCKSCVKCCLKELEGANDLRRELIELQAEKNRLRQVAANLDDVNGFWEAVRGMTLGDAGRPVVARLMLTMAAIDNWRSCMCGECSCEKCGPILGPRYSVKSQGDLIASDRRNQGRRVFLTIAPATATHCGTDTAQQNRCSRLFFQHGNWFCSFVESGFLEGGKDGQKIPSRLRQCISAELGDVEQRAARR